MDSQILINKVEIKILLKTLNVVMKIVLENSGHKFPFINETFSSH